MSANMAKSVGHTSRVKMSASCNVSEPFIFDTTVEITAHVAYAFRLMFVVMLYFPKY